MTPAELDRRLIHSRRVLAGWRTFPGPLQGPVENMLTMISAEIGLLEEWAAEQPTKARKIAVLVERWRELAARLRERAN